jgi:hypothetical protein
MTGSISSGFQTTRWTLVQAAAVHPTLDSRRALSTLRQAYWQPVYAFIRRNGYDPDQSQDLTQGFFALMLEKNYLIQADHFSKGDWPVASTGRPHSLVRASRKGEFDGVGQTRQGRCSHRRADIRILSVSIAVIRGMRGSNDRSEFSGT